MNLNIEELVQYVSQLNFKVCLYIDDYYALMKFAESLDLVKENPIINEEDNVLFYHGNILFEGEMAKLLIEIYNEPIAELIVTAEQFPDLFGIKIPVELKAKDYQESWPLAEIFEAINADLPIYKNIVNYILFNYHPSTCEQAVEVLNFARFAEPTHIEYFLMSNFSVCEALFDPFNIFAMNRIWLQFNGELPEAFVKGFAAVNYEQLYEILNKLFNNYTEFLSSLCAKDDFKLLVVESRYDIVTQSTQFQAIVSLYHRYFYNVCSLEHFELIDKSQKLLNEKFECSDFKEFKPIFSLQRAINESEKSFNNGIVKYNIAYEVFPKITALIVNFFIESDENDILLEEIDKISEEQIAIIEDDNFEQNELVEETVNYDKLSIVFEPIIAEYIDNCHSLFIDELREYENFNQIIDILPKKISNFRRIFPAIDKFCLTFSVKQSTFKDSRIALPGFCFSAEFEQFVEELTDNKEIEYNNETAAYLAAVVIHFETLSKMYSKLSLTNAKDQAEQCSKKLSRSKQQLMKFILYPEQLAYYNVKEEIVEGRKEHTIEDLYAQGSSSILLIIENLVIYLFLMNEKSQFFQIAEDYEKMREYEPAGISQEIGGTYHYDCLIKDTILSDALRCTVRELSVPAFRFLIIMYCSLIFVSSLVFKQYKGHGAQDNIISPFSTLEQDRFIYLICEISNSFNVLCNVKGFTEKGAIGYINVIFQSFMIEIDDCRNFKDLENDIMNCDFDTEIARICDILKETSQNDTENDNTVASARTDSDVLKQQDEQTNLQELISELRENERKQNLWTGEKVLMVFKTDKVEDFLLQFSERGEQESNFVDFTRSTAKIYEELEILALLAIKLKNLIISQYNKKLLLSETQIISPLNELYEDNQQLILMFLRYYEFLAPSLQIRNECQIDAFPVITKEVVLQQLIQIDGCEGVSCVLDEILKELCWISQHFNGEKKELTEENLERNITISGLSLTAMLTECRELETIWAVFQTMNEFEFVNEPLECKETAVVKQGSYYDILTDNAEICLCLPDLESSKSVYNELQSVPRDEEFNELEMYCEELVEMLIKQENIDLNANLHDYFFDLYATEFDNIDNFEIKDCLIIAAYM